ncbi:hypothetical protein SRHO_G00255730 [Serrasalmus rhombeus]
MRGDLRSVDRMATCDHQDTILNPTPSAALVTVEVSNREETASSANLNVELQDSHL